jgi:hypothetical protein
MGTTCHLFSLNILRFEQAGPNGKGKSTDIKKMLKIYVFFLIFRRHYSAGCVRWVCIPSGGHHDHRHPYPQVGHARA